MKKEKLSLILAVAVMSVCIVLGLTSCSFIDEDKISKNAENNGYTLNNQNEKILYIEKGGALYYYEVGVFDIHFDKCVIPVKEEDVEVKKGKAEVIISEENKNKVRVTVHDSRVLINDDGSEEEQYAVTYYICDKKFDSSSIESKTMIDSDVKAKKAYKHVERFLTTEELKDYYNKALTIRDQLNGKNG
ncbi:hypothetical protein D6853_11220 [Butyrivibrio sp. X503]|uniref:hypothetical protein n=1 Tax=Butyrivibrio sp. X503 TaxID=2364878 RepID=UPI000EA979C1|nr:hypothetical protein [Butyrivibrio sp. X503]RKM55282.1 hypothetical protein D6853_11220 [Butyrivibrio sp. X503]